MAREESRTVIYPADRASPNPNPDLSPNPNPNLSPNPNPNPSPNQVIYPADRAWRVHSACCMQVLFTSYSTMAFPPLATMA